MAACRATRALITTAALTAAALTAAALSPLSTPAASALTTRSPHQVLSEIDPAPCSEHLIPNHVYRAEGAEYHTDSQGRPVRAEADDLTASPADRGPCQRRVGHMGPTAGYDGGHLIAATLHGVDRRYDLVPQWASLNRGLYEKMEAGSKRCLTKPGGRIVHYRITVSYEDDVTVTPDIYRTDVELGTSGHDAQDVRLTIPNRQLESTEYGRLRGELERRLTAAGCN